jgi:hypothetical protein
MLFLVRHLLRVRVFGEFHARTHNDFCVVQKAAARDLSSYHRGVDLIPPPRSAAIRLWYGGSDAANDAIGYAKFFSRSHDAVIRVLRCSGHRHRNARAHRGFQGVVSALFWSPWASVRWQYRGLYGVIPEMIVRRVLRALRGPKPPSQLTTNSNSHATHPHHSGFRPRQAL